ncbi:hypothetical protein BP00DRAFT_3480 [Aspergillus indologenus CBS 114.80]|uniref:Uncharacterized protein n=1 Tax=Aspergillus indologenus CBS 114.80 TaxID=1450541 RepID=A0A2V5IRA8_9EURO|nr:hypothetical protein BP00DRAFT_3480 [Aspergillus indologenus CBS 114.80]
MRYQQDCAAGVYSTVRFPRTPAPTLKQNASNSKHPTSSADVHNTTSTLEACYSYLIRESICGVWWNVNLCLERTDQSRNLTFVFIRSGAGELACSNKSRVWQSVPMQRNPKAYHLKHGHKSKFPLLVKLTRTRILLSRPLSLCSMRSEILEHLNQLEKKLGIPGPIMRLIALTRCMHYCCCEHCIQNAFSPNQTTPRAIS